MTVLEGYEDVRLAQRNDTGVDDGTRRLSLPAKLALMAEILVTYVRVRRSLMRDQLPSTLAALREGVTAPDGSHRRLAAWRLASAVVRVLERLPSDSRCLTRSLVLTRVLARRGIGSSLVIGVTPGPNFAAHAWVELDGVPLLPAEEPI
jgi:hypothetical protein